MTEVLVGRELVRGGKRAAPARSSRHALLWLTFRQAQVLFWILAIACPLVGLFVPAHGQFLWPVATLLLGVACGTAAFSQEQSDLSYQFLATQHLPLKKIWDFKTLFWLTTAVLVALLLAGGGIVTLLGKQLLALRQPAPGPGEELGEQIQPPPADEPSPAGFDFGPLPDAMGRVVYFGVWLVYGFTMGQVFVLFCRKTILAVVLATFVGATAVALWLPSLLCQGMAGWQVWLPPLLLLAACRMLVRPWAGGRIKERKPLALAIGFAAVALGWALVNFGFRAWEIPAVGAPLDREEFRTSIPAADNQAGQKIQQALAEMSRPPEAGKTWRARMAEITRLPLGVIDTPPSGGNQSLLRHLPACRTLTARLRSLAEKALAERRPGPAFDHLAQILALSRNLRNKAPLPSYLAGVEAEQSALDGLDLWLAAGRPTPDLLRRVLDELNRHAADTPSALDCLQTECYRSGGVLDTPTYWAFYPGSGVPGKAVEGWLANWISLSLEMPWEKERKTRLWRAVWAGLFRAIRTPHWELPSNAGEPGVGTPTTRKILAGWLPAVDGPGSSLTAGRLARLLDASWLSDEQLFAAVVPLRSAATRARWRVDACRLRVALGLYQLREGKPAQRLADLVPNYLRALPIDPYSGRAIRYRISGGEQLVIAGDEAFQGRNGPGKDRVQPGQGIIWSTGPDRTDHGGRRDGGALGDDNEAWAGMGLDLIAVVPLWP
jgi:hypothetical protein